MKKIEISFEELQDLTGEERKFPTYVRPILNLANKYAQGMRPKVVGQLSELIKGFPGRTFDEWTKWYSEKNPRAVDNAVRSISRKLEEFKRVIHEIDEDTIRKWVEELVYVKTFVGLIFQEPLLKKLASDRGVNYRLSTTHKEESKGINGYLGDKSVSIKPKTYKQRPELTEELEADEIIFYEKKKDKIIVELNDA